MLVTVGFFLAVSIGLVWFLGTWVEPGWPFELGLGAGIAALAAAYRLGQRDERRRRLTSDSS